MSDRPFNPIQEGDQHRFAVASKFVSSLFVTYPSFDVWRSVYDPHHSNDQRWSTDEYRRMRQDYSSSVTKLLNRIHSYSAGTAVLRQLQVTKHIVEIYPMIFRAAWEMGKDEDGGEAVAFTKEKRLSQVQNQIAPWKKPFPQQVVAAFLTVRAASTRRLER